MNVVYYCSIVQAAIVQNHRLYQNSGATTKYAVETPHTFCIVAIKDITNLLHTCLIVLNELRYY